MYIQRCIYSCKTCDFVNVGIYQWETLSSNADEYLLSNLVWSDCPRPHIQDISEGRLEPRCFCFRKELSIHYWILSLIFISSSIPCSISLDLHLLPYFSINVYLCLCRKYMLDHGCVTGPKCESWKRSWVHLFSLIAEQSLLYNALEECKYNFPWKPTLEFYNLF